jgi:hypothetical protein
MMTNYAFTILEGNGHVYRPLFSTPLHRRKFVYQNYRRHGERRNGHSLLNLKRIVLFDCKFYFIKDCDVV